MSAKLHELLAVEGNLETQATKLATDLKATFSGKRHLFEEKLVTFTPNAEGSTKTTESQTPIQTTVTKELEWFGKHLVKSLDASLQVAVANTKASADIVLDDGSVLARSVPATALLELEKRIGSLHELVASIPTLDPAKGFSLDEARGAGVYKALPIRKTRTKKIQRPITLAPATEHHPAQVSLIPEDVPVGEVEELEWSGMLTPAAKADMLSRCEDLKRAVRSARSRANEVEVSSEKYGATLLAYVFGK